MGFCDTSTIGGVGVWIYSTKLGAIMVWHHPCSSNINDTLVSDTNPGGALTNSYLKLAVLVLHKATLLAELPESIMESAS